MLWWSQRLNAQMGQGCFVKVTGCAAGEDPPSPALSPFELATLRVPISHPPLSPPPSSPSK